MNGNVYKIIYNLLLKPASGLEEVNSRKPWLLLLFLLMAVNASRVVGGAVALSMCGGPGRVMLIYGLGLGFPVMIIACFTITGIFHLSAEFWKAEGSSRELFLLLGFCMTPVLFITPLSLIARGFGSAAIFFFILFTAGINIWAAIMSVLAIRKTYCCTVELALRIFFAPLFLVFIVFVMLPVVILLGAVAFI